MIGKSCSLVVFWEFKGVLLDAMFDSVSLIITLIKARR